MIAHCTYCSRDKRDDPGELPAIERYLDRRIRDVATRAEAAGELFLILSGEYGLLRADDPIPWYDHLLVADEVADLASIVEDQLRTLGVTELVYYSVDLGVDPLVGPYRRVIAQACDGAGVCWREGDITSITGGQV
ncbi:hypothetical protein H8E07_02930 [bacterium]|nr:hypothetical protein [bacterium]